MNTWTAYILWLTHIGTLAPSCIHVHKYVTPICLYVMFWPFDPAKNAIQGDAPKGSDILMTVMRGNRVGGNWLMKWDEVKKSHYTHIRLTHQKRVASELHDSYFHSMTITQAIPKKAEVTHPDRQTSEEIAEAWRCVHITALEFEGNKRQTNWTEDSWVRVPVERSCGRESHTRPRGLRLSSHEERERHNAEGHNFGVEIFQLCSVSSSLSHANFE